LEEVLRSGWLCEDKHAEASQVEAGYIFPGEMVCEVVYQEAGAVRQRLIQRRVVAVLQEEAERDQDEEACLSQPTPIDRYALAETRGTRARHVLTGAVSKEMSGIQQVSQSAVVGIDRINWPLQMSRRRADTSRDKKVPLVAYGLGEVVEGPIAFPRSPPGTITNVYFEAD